MIDCQKSEWLMCWVTLSAAVNALILSWGPVKVELKPWKDSYNTRVCYKMDIGVCDKIHMGAYYLLTPAKEIW